MRQGKGAKAAVKLETSHLFVCRARLAPGPCTSRIRIVTRRNALTHFITTRRQSSTINHKTNTQRLSVSFFIGNLKHETFQFK